MVVGSGSSLSQKSKLLLPVPLKPQSRWYEFADSTMPLSRKVPLEFGELVNSHPETVTGKTTSISSELLLLETLSMNAIRVTSWLDLWLTAYGEIVEADSNSLHREMIISG